MKTLDALEVTRAGDEIQIEARARSFLHHQVRNMVGTLEAGRRRASGAPADVAAALAARDRRAGGPTAPAEGSIWSRCVYPRLTSDSDVRRRCAQHRAQHDIEQ